MLSFLTKKKVKNDIFFKICFTGHRPKGLPWGYDEEKESCILFKNIDGEISLHLYIKPK